MRLDCSDRSATSASVNASAVEGSLQIYVDADACPVKEEIFKVAGRYALDVTVVAGSWMRIPADPSFELHVAGEGFDAADNWIVDQVVHKDIVITADIPLAARCLERGSCVLGPTGRSFTVSNIGDALAMRNLLAEMRGAGIESGGPAPFQPRDRSNFLQALDRAICALRRT